MIPENIWIKVESPEELEELVKLCKPDNWYAEDSFTFFFNTSKFWVRRGTYLGLGDEPETFTLFRDLLPLEKEVRYVCKSFEEYKRTVKHLTDKGHLWSELQASLEDLKVYYEEDKDTNGVAEVAIDKYGKLFRPLGWYNEYPSRTLSYKKLPKCFKEL